MTMSDSELNGGDIVARVLREHGVSHLFTLCGGHTAPILCGARKERIRVVDVRHEATAVFAADALARRTGTPGVAVVTAGPGITNSVTALKNAQLAQSPVLLIGGAAPTVLKNRGALQDIDQLRLLKPIVKDAASIRRNCDIVPVIEEGLKLCLSGVPGPVFVECPIDVLYPEELVRQWYGLGPQAASGRDIKERVQQAYLKHHVDRMFACDFGEMSAGEIEIPERNLKPDFLGTAADWIGDAARPVMIIGSQAVAEAGQVNRLAEAVAKLDVPVFLTGMARGLLGQNHRLQVRHQRKKALRDADLVILAGMPCDFRLDYGRSLSRQARLISVNRSKSELKLNCRPDLGIHGDPLVFLGRLAETLPTPVRGREDWIDVLRKRDLAREDEIERMSLNDTEFVNPLRLLRELDDLLDGHSILVADGGDFVATASYILRPRAPLSWLDPGVFGTLGVGAGFALGARVSDPEAELWLLYGDGAAGFSLQEFDTFVRHGISIIAVVGNDAGWTQIGRDQVEFLGDDVGTVLRRTDYHRVAEGFGGRGFLLDKPDDIGTVLRQAKAAAREGHAVLINAMIGRTDFRKGSISM
jgi:thiamine pyrophosphate-dependent acetolactate synthase large subunit-like protein